jgi:hypothetical protein
MSKLGPNGEPLLREDGKVMKGPNYFRPNIGAILDSHLAQNQGEPTAELRVERLAWSVSNEVPVDRLCHAEAVEATYEALTAV